jgi:hypothetical protein
MHHCTHTHDLAQIWTYDAANNKLRPEGVKLGNLQRQFRSLEVDAQDRYAYAGTTSGDVLQVDVERPAGTALGVQPVAAP